MAWKPFRGGPSVRVGRSASVREGHDEPAPFNLSGLLAGAVAAILIVAIAYSIAKFIFGALLDVVLG